MYFKLITATHELTDNILHQLHTAGHVTYDRQELYHKSLTLAVHCCYGYLPSSVFALVL